MKIRTTPQSRHTNHRSHTSRLRTVAVSALAAATLSGTLLAACGNDDNKADAQAPATAAVTVAPATAPASDTHADHATDQPSAETQLYAAMRSLWDEHMEWTWNVVVAFASDSPGLSDSIDRLLRNQQDIGAAVGSFYGDEAGRAIADLLTTHITDAVPVLTAAKDGDEAGLATALEEWYRNAAEIGDFLAAANPQVWSQESMRDMMKTHIDQTVAYASDVLGNDWTAAIATFDAAQSHMQEMADMLSAGIIAQFPQNF